MRIPLYIDLSGRNVVIVGGGKVGERRALKFLEAGAKVKVVANDFTEKLKEMAQSGKIVIEKKDLDNDIEVIRAIKDADIVVIATNSKKLNDKVFSIAQVLGKFINDATDAQRSHIHVPFEGSVDGIRFAVTSEGAAGVAAHIALYVIEECLRRNSLLHSINQFSRLFKEWVKREIKDPKVRFQTYWYVMLDPDVFNLIKSSQIDKALELAKLKVLKGVPEKGYEPDKAFPKFIQQWKDELLGSC
ncbi:siroheme synthase [Ignicoccus islandicus DSM 13165]|uniref:precorrin-2 dehydrogenase n=1 Tax=Ignicoccus islandicus DSM 13165 TaxID=940295 RepID=A0A0U3DW19_9CREN|nr:bifunctional precorrin-2 dehydrogenase/sirohydrochlorin ferrochelatase [Ignicoccus islandicus]ALU11658.1 siroheme synthase [Ignicoccus islandicus DSM 13165]